jgi:hypothetical protein
MSAAACPSRWSSKSGSLCGCCWCPLTLGKRRRLSTQLPLPGFHARVAAAALDVAADARPHAEVVVTALGAAAFACPNAGVAAAAPYSVAAARSLLFGEPRLPTLYSAAAACPHFGVAAAALYLVAAARPTLG